MSVPPTRSDPDTQPARKQARVEIASKEPAATSAVGVAASEMVDLGMHEMSHGNDELAAPSPGPAAHETHNSPLNSSEPSNLQLDTDSVAARVQQQSWSHPCRATVEDCSDEDNDRPSANESLSGESDDDNEPFAMHDDDEEDEAGLSVKDRINEDVERDLAEFGESSTMKLLSDC